MYKDAIVLRGAIVAFAMASTVAARAEESPLGLWIDHTGRGGIEISDCNGKLCGHVAWLKDAGNADQCGKQIIGNVASVGKNKWDNGWIYDPDRGSKFDVELTLLPADKLRVKGYAGTKWLSETHTWKRAPADIQKCSANGETSASAKPAAPAESEKQASIASEPDNGTPGIEGSKPEPNGAQNPIRLNGADAERSADTKAGAAAPAAPATDTSKPEASKRSGTETERSKSAKDEASKPNATAHADEQDDEGAPRRRGRIMARIMERLESGDGPVKLRRSGATCRLDVPYAGEIEFPCKRDE